MEAKRVTGAEAAEILKAGGTVRHPFVSEYTHAPDALRLKNGSFAELRLGEVEAASPWGYEVVHDPRPTPAVPERRHVTAAEARAAFSDEGRWYVTASEAWDVVQAGGSVSVEAHPPCRLKWFSENGRVETIDMHDGFTTTSLCQSRNTWPVEAFSAEGRWYVVDEPPAPPPR